MGGKTRTKKAQNLTHTPKKKGYKKRKRRKNYTIDSGVPVRPVKLVEVNVVGLQAG